MITFFIGLYSHFSVEHVTSCEVEHSKGKLRDWIIFYIYSVMQRSFKTTDTHIWLTTFLCNWCLTWHCQMISQKLLLFQLGNELGEQISLICSTFPGYENIHITTRWFTSSIRTTNLYFMWVFATCYLK